MDGSAAGREVIERRNRVRLAYGLSEDGRTRTYIFNVRRKRFPTHSVGTDHAARGVFGGTRRGQLADQHNRRIHRFTARSSSLVLHWSEDRRRKISAVGYKTWPLAHAFTERGRAGVRLV